MLRNSGQALDVKESWIGDSTRTNCMIPYIAEAVRKSKLNVFQRTIFRHSAKTQKFHFCMIELA